jgi:pimeloyl-ACP methyl ester carboxylesterase
MGASRLDHFRGGTGEPLVLLHGMFQSWHDWSPVLDRLTAEREVFAPTHLGHRGSPPFEAGQLPTIAAWTDAVGAAMDTVGLDRPDVAGHSLGGWVALELAKRGRARSVVAISPAGRYTDEDLARIARLLRRSHRLARWLLPLARRVVRTSIGRKALLADSCADPRRISPEQAERLVVNLASCPDLDGFVGALEDESGKAIRFSEAERVPCPVLIVLPERDRFFTRFHAEHYAEAVPGATVVVLRDCGHTAMFDHPELVSSTILRFAATTPSEG